MDIFIRAFLAYRLDGVLRDWKPYAEVAHNALMQTCKRNRLAVDPAVAVDIYNRADTSGRGPEDVLHVSSSFRYELMTAHDLGITTKVWVNHGHEPANPSYG